MDSDIAVWVTRLLWVLPLVLLVAFYKLVLRVFGVVIIPEDSIGIVNKKFVLFGQHRTLPDGAIIALERRSGPAGRRAGAGAAFRLLAVAVRGHAPEVHHDPGGSHRHRGGARRQAAERTDACWRGRVALRLVPGRARIPARGRRARPADRDHPARAPTASTPRCSAWCRSKVLEIAGQHGRHRHHARRAQPLATGEIAGGEVPRAQHVPGRPGVHRRRRLQGTAGAGHAGRPLLHQPVVRDRRGRRR